MRRLLQRLSFLCLLSLAGCADVSMPDYRRPDTPAKPGWSRQQAAPISAAEAIMPEWWKGFGDPYLDQLVKTAIGGNIDVRILAARIRVANAEITEVRAGALPTVDAAAAVSYDKRNDQPSRTTYSVGAALNWEADVWGKVKKASRRRKPNTAPARPTGAPVS